MAGPSPTGAITTTRKRGPATAWSGSGRASSSARRAGAGNMLTEADLGRVLSRSIRREESRIPDDLPDMPVRILEITGIASIERVLRLLENGCAGFARLLHHLIDLAFARDVVADRKTRRAARRL